MALDPTKLPVPNEGDWLAVRRAFQILREYEEDAATLLENHHARHENGGADEPNLVGLSGLLADPQTPLQHGIANGTYHSSSVAANQIMMGDANGLPCNATNTNAEVASAVSLKHSMQHSISSASNHTSTVAANYVMIGDANGLPANGTNTDSELSSAVSLKHAMQHAITSSANHTSSATANQVLIADANGLPVDGTNTNTQVSETVTNALTGFVNSTDSTLAMSGANFAIAPAVTSFVFYSEGKKYTKTASPAMEVAISNDNTLHYVYFDNDGVLQVSTDTWSINSDKALVALVYKTGAAYAIFNERHYYNRNRRWHSWAHYTIGARYYSGFTGTFTDTTLSVTQGVIEDEDIVIDTGGTKTACRLWYRNNGGASMTFESNVTTPYKIVAGAIKYDTGGATALASVTNNYYVASYVYATPDQDYPIAVVVGQNQYAGTPAGLAACRAEAVPTIAAGINVEWKMIYQVIYQNAGGTPDYIEANDKRTVSTGPAGVVTSGTHSALVGRDAPSSHPATAVSANVSSFGGILSAADTDVQLALDTIDDHNHALLYDAIGTANSAVSAHNGTPNHADFLTSAHNGTPNHADFLTSAHNGTPNHADFLTSSHNSTPNHADFLTSSHNGTPNHAILANNALIDHGSIGGLDGDDHAQYFILTGIRALTGNLGLANHTITMTPIATPANAAETMVFSRDVSNGELAFKDGANRTCTITSNGTLNAAAIPNTAVSAGTYSSANITVGADGRLTSAANGSGGTTYVNAATTQMRLSACSLSAVYTGSLSSVSNAYLVRYNGDRVACYNGSAWVERTMSRDTKSVVTITTHGANVANGSPLLSPGNDTLTSKFTNCIVGMKVSCNSLPANTVISAINANGTLTVSQNANQTITNLTTTFSVPANSVCDVFAYWDDTDSNVVGTLGPIWSNTTTRATDLDAVDGVAVLNGNYSVIAANGTYTTFTEGMLKHVGTVMTNALDGYYNMSFGFTPAAGGSAPELGLSNKYNRLPFGFGILDAPGGAGTWAYNSTTKRSLDNSTGNRLKIVCCESGIPIFVSAFVLTYGADYGLVGIGVDSTTVDSSQTFVFGGGNGAGQMLPAFASYCGSISEGSHYLQLLEWCLSGGVSVTYYSRQTSEKSGCYGWTML